MPNLRYNVGTMRQIGKINKLSDNYYWTQHALLKMKYYQLSAQRVKRVIKCPIRVEEGVAPNTCASMQPLSMKGKKWTQEIWAMWQWSSPQKQKKRVISVWRYPGVSPARQPIEIPDDALMELEKWKK